MQVQWLELSPAVARQVALRELPVEAIGIAPVVSLDLTVNIAVVQLHTSVDLVYTHTQPHAVVIA
jgi:hypothetical protein